MRRRRALGRGLVAAGTEVGMGAGARAVIVVGWHSGAAAAGEGIPTPSCSARRPLDNGYSQPPIEPEPEGPEPEGQNDVDDLLYSYRDSSRRSEEHHSVSERCDQERDRGTVD